MRSFQTFLVFAAAILAALFFWPYLNAVAARGAVDQREEQMLVAELVVLALLGVSKLSDDALIWFMAGVVVVQVALAVFLPTVSPPMGLVGIFLVGAAAAGASEDVRLR